MRAQRCYIFKYGHWALFWIIFQRAPPNPLGRDSAAPLRGGQKTPQVRHETGSCGIFRYFIRFSTTSTTWSAVKPNFSNSFAAGAEAPKDFMLITAPSRPV